MASNKDCVDPPSQPSAVAPRTEDPPAYSSLASLDIPSTLAMIEKVVDIVYGEEPDCIEDGRRSLAVCIPSTDTPWEARIAEANAWVAEQNDLLTNVKRRYGCATHELALSQLMTIEDALSIPANSNFFKGQTVATVIKKAKSATAVSRGVTEVSGYKDNMPKKAANQAWVHALNDWGETAVVALIAADIANFNNNIASQLSSLNSDIEDVRVFAVGYITEWKARTVGSHAFLAIEHHKFIAEQTTGTEAIEATEKTVRALSAYLVAESIALAALDITDPLRRRLYPTESRVPAKPKVPTKPRVPAESIFHRIGCWIARTTNMEYQGQPTGRCTTPKLSSSTSKASASSKEAETG